MRATRDIGETLIEVVITVVIIGLTVTSLLSSLGTVSMAGTAQRSGVQSDLVLRNYAEATKAAVQNCLTGGTFTVVYQPPTGFTISGPAAGSPCPSTTALTLTPVKLTVVDPQNRQLFMYIKVRTP